jgi:N-acetyl-alpha-D-muramate 1-phosphate uridylyltransferase
MKAMILAAGRGERMKPLTDATPKPLLIVGGKPLIVWLIERLVRAGIVNLVVNVSHLGEQIESALGEGSAHGARIAYSRECEALETAGGIAWALPLIGDAPFIVANSDVYSDYDFAPLAYRAAGLSEGGVRAHMVMVNNPPHHPAGDFSLKNNRLTASGAKHLTFSGYGAYHPTIFKSVVRGEKCRLATTLEYPMSHGQITGEHYRGQWSDIGTPERLAELDAWLRVRSAL